MAIVLAVVENSNNMLLYHQPKCINSSLHLTLF